MSIVFNEEKQMFNLKTKNTSYIMGICREYLVHAYYGKRIEHEDSLADALGRDPFSVRSFMTRNFLDDGKTCGLCLEALPQEYPAFNSDLREPAFHAQYEDGTAYTELKYKGHEIYKGKRPLPGLPAVYAENEAEADSIDITLEDTLKGIEIVLTYSVFSDYDAITRSVKVVNCSKENITLKRVLSASVDFVHCDFEMTNLYGGWAKERRIDKKPLFKGTERIDSKRGSSSHFQNPFMALSALDATNSYGDVYGFSLVYSGNFEAFAQVSPEDNETRACIGINSFDFSWLLEPGQEFNAPEAVLTYSDRGFDGMSNIYHKLYRERLCRGKYRDGGRPVLINSWEATYFNFDEAKVLELAQNAKKADIELVVLDDGWFGKRNSDTCSLGDWNIVDKNKLPNGIDGLVKKVNDIGVKFGLWFEPEMISPDSELYRAHPDWCIHIKDRPRYEGRQQLILDFSRDEVCDYIIDVVSNVLSSANIEYVKWDMNRNMSEVGNEVLPPERQKELPHRYMLGLYRVLETLTSRFPNILFEGCSGGGGRFDPGMLHYFPQFWTSDNTDAIERLYIHEGTFMVYPPSTMGSHVSSVPNHQVGRTTPMQARASVAMTGQFGYELDLAKLSEEEFEQVRGQVALYKEIGPVIQKAEYHRIKSVYTDGYSAWLFTSADKEKAVLMICTALGHANSESDFIKLRGLIPDALYKERFTGRVVRGEFLMNSGWHFRRGHDYESAFLFFEKQ